MHPPRALHAPQLLLLLLLGVLSFSPLLAAPDGQDFLLVAHPSNRTSHLTPFQFRQILHGKLTTWPKGERLTLIIPRSSPRAEGAIVQFATYSTDQFINHWKRLLYIGRGRMPTLVSDETEALQIVAQDPSALSIISPQTPPRTVRPIPILPPPS